MCTDYPHSIREINDLPDDQKHAIFSTLLPDWLVTQYRINRETLLADGMATVQLRCPRGSRAFEMSVKRQPEDLDPVIYLNMADTFNNQLLVLLVVVNDLDSVRYDIDVDMHGITTHLGTNSRNLVAEEAAFRAGLAPGQVRRGLRSFKQSIPVFEDFVGRMGHDLFLIEPMAYHNAIVFERYGFNYLRGYRDMVQIDKEFRPGGDFYSQLSPESIFRGPDSWKTVRGRSWAIHDGILGHPFTGFQMYKRIGIDAGINSFHDSEW